MIGQEIWFDYFCPRFLPKELRSCESMLFRVIRSLSGGVLEIYHSVKGSFKVDGKRVKDAKPMLNLG